MIVDGPGVGQDCTPVDACLNSDRGEEPHGEASLHGGAPAAVAQKSNLIRGNGFLLERRKIVLCYVLINYRI